MIKEDFLKMSMRDINALVAEKVMGWKKYEDYVYIQPTAAEPNFRYCDSRNTADNYTFIPFHPAFDISAAWEVLKQPKKFDFSIIFMEEDIPEPYCCDIVTDFEPYDFVAWAETAPLAICQAALLMVEK